MYKTIRPGKVLYDTEGCVVQAHGGSILYHNGKFYFYGENKEGITGTATGERCKNWTNGFEQLNGHNSLKKLNSEFKAAISM